MNAAKRARLKRKPTAAKRKRLQKKRFLLHGKETQTTADPKPSATETKQKNDHRDLDYAFHTSNENKMSRRERQSGNQREQRNELPQDNYTRRSRSTPSYG